MTYLQFLVVLVLPVIVALAEALRRVHVGLGPRARWSLPILAIIAFAWTTPWDNYLVWRGVWGYGEDRVLAVIGMVPVEEYLFFLLQPVLTGLWFYVVLSRATRAGRVPVTQPERVSLLPAGAWLLAALAGLLLLRTERTTYLGLIVVWACPVLAAQYAYAAREIVRLRAAVLAGIALPTLYLWIADAIAIRLGIWTIAERFTTGVGIFGLPLEEAVFFLLTNVLIVQGLVMFLFPRRAPAAGPAV